MTFPILLGAPTRHLFRALLALALCLAAGSARSTELTLAGFAFSGDLKSAAQRFPYSYAVFQRLRSSPGDSLSARITARARGVSNPSLALQPAGTMVNLKNGDRALMAVLTLSDEIVSTEDFGAYYKTFVNLRGSLLIFDYKNQQVVRTYPLSTVLFDATPRPPTREEIAGFVENLLLRADGHGLITQFTRSLASATLPADGARTLQVHSVRIAPEALALMPPMLRGNPKAIEALLADAFAATLSAKAGVPLLPNNIGHAVGGVMTLQLENGDDYKLKLGEGDYLFDVALNKFAKIKTGETNVGVSYVYGAYASLRFYEPVSGTEFMRTDIKNGESTVVPVTQLAGDDFTAYQDAIRGLFIKLSKTLEGGDSKWIESAASAKDIGSQLDAARKVLRTCK